jgi:hypothetical protein
MSLQVGELYARLGLDDKPYHFGLASAAVKAEAFTAKEWKAKLGLQTKGLDAQLAGAKLKMAGLAASVSGKPILLPLSMDPGPVKSKFATLGAEMTAMASAYGTQIGIALAVGAAALLVYSVENASDLNETMNKSQVPQQRPFCPRQV